MIEEFAFTDANSIELPDGRRVMRGDLRPCLCCGCEVFEVVEISKLVKERGREEYWGLPTISVQCPTCLGIETLDRYALSRQRRKYLGTLDMISGLLCLMPESERSRC